MHYQKVLSMLNSIPYLSVGLDVGADFTWMSIMLPNGTLAKKLEMGDFDLLRSFMPTSAFTLP